MHLKNKIVFCCQILENNIPQFQKVESALIEINLSELHQYIFSLQESKHQALRIGLCLFVILGLMHSLAIQCFFAKVVLYRSKHGCKNLTSFRFLILLY